MLFVEFRFVLFFLVVVAVHWMLQGLRARKVWLLLASHFFYACFFVGGLEGITGDRPLPTGWWFPAVLWSSTVMDYLAGLRIGAAATESRRKAWWL